MDWTFVEDALCAAPVDKLGKHERFQEIAFSTLCIELCKFVVDSHQPKKIQT